ncbi:hypothetical protein EG867_16585, partial [Enterococcus faecalis]
MEEAGDFPAEAAVDLKKEFSCGGKPLPGEGGDGSVIKQGVLIGYKKCRGRLILQNMGFHLRFFTVGDIGWIADDQFRGFPASKVLPVEDVGFEKAGAGGIGQGI